MVDGRFGFRSAIVAGALALVLAACSTAAVDTTAVDTTAEEPQERLSIVAVTSILGSIVNDVVGDTADVTVLIGPGIDPHSYQASARDGQLLRDADLVVANGPLDDVPLEENLSDLLATVRSEEVDIFDFVANIDAISFASENTSPSDDNHSDDDHSDDDDHGYGDLDPHFWWDLSQVAAGIEQLAEAIAAVDTERSADFWAERGTAVAQIYRDLDQEITQTVSVLSEDQRVIVTNHDSMEYFAARYGFTVRATVIPGASTSVEANPREFAQLIDLIVDENVRVIFADNTDSTRLAEQLTTQVAGQRLDDLRVVHLYTDALGPAGSGADTFTTMVRTTVGLIVDALG